MITNQEKNELLADSGVTEKDLRVIFSEMGVDYDAPEFDDNLVENVMKMAEDLGFAFKEIKRLNAVNPTATPLSTELVTQQVADLMFQSLEEQGISFSMEAVLSLARSRAEQYIELSDKVNQLAERVYAAREAHNQKTFVSKLINQSTRSIEVIEELLGDEAQHQLIASLTPQSRLNGEVQTFVSMLDSRRKAKAQIEGRRQEEVNALPPQEPKQVLGAFLASMKKQ